MFKKVQFYLALYKRFGIRSLRFLIIAKFKKDELINIRIPGFKTTIRLSNFTTDVTTLFQIFFAGEYNITLDKAPKFIIDCGANIGLSAVYFAHQYPTAMVIAIEPDAENFKYLIQNTLAYPNVHCIRKAIWPRMAQLEIVDPGTGNWGLQTRELSHASIASVDAITLDAILIQWQIEKIDLLKIDIEGAEKELFSSNHAGWLSKTAVMTIELHDFFDPTISPVFEAAIAPYHFTKYYLGENLVCKSPLL